MKMPEFKYIDKPVALVDHILIGNITSNVNYYPSMLTLILRWTDLTPEVAQELDDEDVVTIWSGILTRISDRLTLLQIGKDLEIDA